MALVPDVSTILSQAQDDEDAMFAEAVIAAIAADEAVVPAPDESNTATLTNGLPTLTITQRFAFDRLIDIGRGPP